MSKNEKLRFTVIFKDRSLIDYKKNTVFISPVTNNNRYQENIVDVNFEVYLNTSVGSSMYEGNTRIQCFEEVDWSNHENFIYKTLSEYDGTEITKTYSLPFFSLMQSMSEYDRISHSLNEDIAVAVLLAIGDVPTNKEFNYGKSRGWHGKVLKRIFSEVSLVDSSSAYYTFYNAMSSLKRIDVDRNHSGKKNFNLKFRLRNFNNEHSFEFKFDENSDFSKRISILIGANGVGKSQTLKNIYQTDTLTSGREFTDRARISKILAFSTSPRVTDSFPNFQSEKTRFEVNKFSLTNVAAQQYGSSNSETLVKLFFNESVVSGKTRFQLFLNAISCLDNGHELAFPSAHRRKPINFTDMEKLFTGSNQMEMQRELAIRGLPFRNVEGKAFKLSSGEMAFVRFALYASVHIDSGTLVLIDEPETHLHPSLITQFVNVLNTLLEDTESIAIIATHSAYFVREVFSDQVQVMSRTLGNEITIATPRLRTFGGDVGLISNFVFGDNEHTDLAKKVLKKLVVTEMDVKNNTKEKIVKKYRDELSQSLLIELLKRVII